MRTGIIAALLLCGALFAEGQGQYYMEPVVRVKGSVRLADVVRAEGMAVPDLELFPSLEEPYFLSRSELMKHTGQAVVYGQGSWIVPLTRTMDQDELLSKLRSSIERLPGGADFLSRHVLRVRGELKTTPQGTGLTFRLPARANSLSVGRRVIAADLVVPENGQDRILVRSQIDVQISRRQKALVARRDLARGTKLSAADFRVEIREFDDDAKPAEENSVGQTLLSDIREGHVIGASSLQKFRTVRRGQSVQAVFQKGAVVLRCRALAMADADTGQELPVRILLPSGRKTDILKANVTGENTVVLR
jgi:flagella basal body P-ring formation protein FlgA